MRSKAQDSNNSTARQFYSPDSKMITIFIVKTATDLSAVSTDSFVKPNSEGFIYALPRKLSIGPAL